MPGYGGGAPSRWRRWAGRLLPAALRGVLAEQEARIEAEAAMAALEAYDGLERMLADERFSGQAVRGQVADVVCAVELRLARLQHERPALCAAAGAQRAAVCVLQAVGAEVQRLHDTFEIGTADCEALIAAHKRRVHEIRSGAAAASAAAPPSAEALVAGHALFRAMPPDRFRAEWAALRSTGTVRFPAGERLMEAGRPSAGPLIIVSGFAKVFDGAAAATAAGRFKRLAAVGRVEGCAEWLTAQQNGPGAEAAAAVLERLTVVAETDVEAVRIAPATLRSLIAAAGPEALRELWRAHGGSEDDSESPAACTTVGRLFDPAEQAGLGAGPVRNGVGMASPSQQHPSVRLAWTDGVGEQQQQPEGGEQAGAAASVRT